MIQSDALSRRPDHCPEEDNDNEDMILLPENLFINRIDIDLQQQIAKVNYMDKDAETALLLLLNGHTTMTGHWKSLKTEIFFSIKDRFLWTKNCDEIF